MNTRYTAQAISFKVYDEEDGKAPQIGVELRVTEGEHAGKEIFWYGSLHENAQQFTVEALRTMGWRCNDITALEGLGSVKVIVVEKPAEMYTDKRTGKQRMGSPKLQIWPVKTPKPTLEADKAKSFASRFKALAASVAPTEVTELNAGLPVDALPAPAPKNGSGTTTAGEGTGTGGVPF